MLTQHYPESICGGKSRQVENFHKLIHLPYFHKRSSEPELLGLQQSENKGSGRMEGRGEMVLRTSCGMPAF